MLRSRRLFRNWLSLGIRYQLVRYGLIKGNNLLTAICRDGNTSLIEPQVYGFIANVYYDGLIAGYDCGSKSVVLTNGSKLPLNRLHEIVGIKYGWFFNGDCWFKGGIMFKAMRWPIIETFELNQYNVIDVRGRVVVDVGAFVGDSAIYFALKGARKVYAIEPHPEAYEEMLMNISLNGLGDKIMPINIAVGRNGVVCISPDNDITSANVTYSMTEVECSGTRVRSIRLGDLIQKYSIEPDVLKMDCEGCEYDVIMNDYDAVKLFKELVFEYHAYATGRPVSELLRALSRDFKCEFVNEGFLQKYQPRYKREELGMIHCINID